MEYKEIDGDHVVYLTKEETDELFDPFDPTDENLPSYLHHARHRFITQEAYDWLETSVGEPKIHWQSFSMGGDKRGFQFETRDKAMLFKLRFHQGEDNGTVDVT